MQISNILSVRLLSIIVGLLLLTGCNKLPLKPATKLTPLKTARDIFSITAENITVCAHKLSAKECKALLGKNLRKITVVQLSVTNATATSYAITKSDIDLPLVPASIVAKEFIPNKALPFAVIGIIGGVMMFPLFLLMPPMLFGSLMGIANSPAPEAMIAKMLGVGLAGVIGTSIGVTTVKRKNQKAENTAYDMMQRLSPNSLSLAPESTESLLLFVKSKNMPNNFNLSIRTADTEKTTHTFSIAL